MAIVVCEPHAFGRLAGDEYVAGVEPHGYPDTAAICAAPGCSNPGLMFLTQRELDDLRAGRLIFTGGAEFTKITIRAGGRVVTLDELGDGTGKAG